MYNAEIINELKSIIEKLEITEVPETPEIHKGTRKPANRAERRKATEKAKKHLREIYPFTYAVKETQNGGYVRTGNTGEWHPVWKKMDKRLSRHAGKEICREYFEEDNFFKGNPFEDEYPDGYWDADMQEFIWDWDIEHEEDCSDSEIRVGGTYFVLCDATYYDSCIVKGKPHIIIATYFGNGEWDNELLYGLNYKVKPVIFPAVDEF